MTVLLSRVFANPSSVGEAIFTVPAFTPLHHFPGTGEGLWPLDSWLCNLGLFHKGHFKGSDRLSQKTYFAIQGTIEITYFYVWLTIEKDETERD